MTTGQQTDTAFRTRMTILRCPQCGARRWFEWPTRLTAPEFVPCRKCGEPVHTQHDKIEERKTA